MKLLSAVIRLIAIAAFLVLMHVVSQQVQIIKQQQYNAMPYLLFIFAASIVFGALLRSDVLFQKNKVFRVDWISLLLIGLPSLIAAASIPVIFLIQPSVELPGFIAYLYSENVRLLAGTLFGYTLVNSLVACKGE